MMLDYNNIKGYDNLSDTAKDKEKLDYMIKEIKELQDLLDHRTRIENEAIKLIEECKFNEAIELLATI